MYVHGVSTPFGSKPAPARAAKPRPAPKPAPKPKAPPAPKREAKARPAAPGRSWRSTVALPAAVFDRVQAAAGFPLPVDEPSKRTFEHAGKLYWPRLALELEVMAAELVPVGQFKGKTFTTNSGSALRPGFRQKINGKDYVWVGLTRFVLSGSSLDSKR